MEMTGGFKVEARGAGDARGGYWRSTGLSRTYVQKVPGIMLAIKLCQESRHEP